MKCSLCDRFLESCGNGFWCERCKVWSDGGNPVDQFADIEELERMYKLEGR